MKKILFLMITSVFAFGVATVSEPNDPCEEYKKTAYEMFSILDARAENNKHEQAEVKKMKDAFNKGLERINTLSDRDNVCIKATQSIKEAIELMQPVRSYQ
ncbi:hypothetical protein [Campylobacter sp. RM16187]|uniref:hypothetical protein n=1 Tax=Campylobacter sp. RM16187 TaxID=1660063 RepID=UPI0021B6AA56|nr:hypothetical protein [Campylobacter sp. RM16187]QKG30037.1 hypothetical protein CDOMF_1808 [Campylobacter sp. RM16187]